MGRACLELGSAELQTILGVLVGFGGTVGGHMPRVALCHFQWWGTPRGAWM